MAKFDNNFSAVSISNDVNSESHSAEFPANIIDLCFNKQQGVWHISLLYLTNIHIILVASEVHLWRMLFSNNLEIEEDFKQRFT